MKNIVIILLLCISEFCYSQNLQYADSMSRAKADIVLSHFDSIHVSKLLYSIDDKYFYILLNVDLCCKEYIVIADSLGSIVKMEGPNKLSRHDKKLLKNLAPFDLTKYNTNYITESSNVMDFTFGQLAYFVIKCNDGTRWGEFHSFMPIQTATIDLKLWAYINRKLFAIVTI